MNAEHNQLVKLITESRELQAQAAAQAYAQQAQASAQQAQAISRLEQSIGEVKDELNKISQNVLVIKGVVLSEMEGISAVDKKELEESLTLALEDTEVKEIVDGIKNSRPVVVVIGGKRKLKKYETWNANAAYRKYFGVDILKKSHKREFGKFIARNMRLLLGADLRSNYSKALVEPIALLGQHYHEQYLSKVNRV